MVFTTLERNPIVEKFIFELENMNTTEIKKEDFKIEITKIRFTKKDGEKIIDFFERLGVLERNGNKIIIIK